MNKILFFILFIFGVLNAWGQDIKYFDDIVKTFDKEKKAKLTDAAKSLKKAQKDFNSAEKLFSAKEISKALSKAKSASSVFKESYRTLFKIFDKKTESLINETEGDRHDYLTNLMQESKSDFRLSIYNRLKAGEVKDDKEAYELLVAAHDGEIKAIDKQSKIFALFNGWETADFSVVKDDSGDELSDAGLDGEDFETRSFSVNDPELENNYKINKKTVIVSGDESGKTGEYVADNGNVNNSVNYNYDETGSPEHEFRLQIGTSILPANESQIKRLNKTDLPVKVYKSSLYYKYTVGSFKSFREAKNYKNAYGLSDVYIAEYKNGKEVKVYLRDILQ